MGIGKMLEPGFEHRSMQSDKRWKMEWKNVQGQGSNPGMLGQIGASQNN